MTHTEKVHVVFGILSAIVGGLALWHLLRPRSRAGLVWPVLVFLIGLILFIPVEAQSRTYQAVPWSDVLLSAVPQHPSTWLGDWLHYLTQRHVVQHKIGGLCLTLAGLVEFLRIRGRLAPRWSLLFPALLLGAALSFGIHGGTAMHLSHHTEQLSHKVLGVLLGTGAVTLALVRSGRIHGRLWEGVWAALVLCLGIGIAVSYRLTPLERSQEVHHHESASPRLR
jgi:hypothetical protein